jgi:hypothetical protein
MNTLTIYARRVPTADYIAKQYAPELARLKKDVVLSFTPGGDAVSRRAWHCNPPDRRNKWVWHNCFKYRLVWAD